MAYLLDSDTFIKAKNFHYGLDFCPGYWDWIVRENNDNNVFSVHRVFQELCEQEDELTGWAKASGKKLFLPLDAATSIKMVLVTNYVQNMASPTIQREKDRFLSKADPHLIACALAHGHIVVTNEIEINDIKFKGVKIPNVCRHFGVPCVTPFQMLRQLGAGFGLLPKQVYALQEAADIEEDASTDDEDYED